MRAARLAVLALAVSAALAAGTPSLARAVPLRAQVGSYQVQILVDGLPVPSFDHGGETWVLGNLGDRYTIRVLNRSPRRIEAVVSVDGRDVVDGRPGDFRTRGGYLVPAWGSIDIEGWRLSQAEAAAFRFSRVTDSYAARTGHGRDVGVIGVAVFPERYPMPHPIYAPPPTGPWPNGPWGSSDAPHGAPSEKGSAGPAAPQAGGAPSAADRATEAAPSPSRLLAEQGRRERPGLGTEFGERVSAPVREVAFTREDPDRPAVILGVRYDDRQGLLAQGIDVDTLCAGCASEEEMRRSADPFPRYDRHWATPPAGWLR